MYKKFIGPDLRHTALNKVHQNTISYRSFSEWSMGFVGAAEIESHMPSSVMGVLMNMLTAQAKSKPLSLGLNAFVSIYNQMRRSPYRWFLNELESAIYIEKIYLNNFLCNRNFWIRRNPCFPVWPEMPSTPCFGFVKTRSTVRWPPIQSANV